MVGTKLDKQHHSCSMHGRRGGVMQRKLYSLIPGFIYIYSIHSKLYAILAFLDINLEKPKCPIIWNLWRSTGASHLFHSLGTCCVIVLLPVPQQLQFFFFSLDKSFQIYNNNFYTSILEWYKKINYKRWLVSDYSLKHKLYTWVFLYPRGVMAKKERPLCILPCSTTLGIIPKQKKKKKIYKMDAILSNYDLSLHY